jgi:general secretion pathway protein K
MSLSDAQSLVALRKGHPFNDISAFEGAQQVAGKQRLGEKPVVRTDYFLVLSQVRLDRAALESWALIKRGPRSPGNSPTSIEWIREI